MFGITSICLFSFSFVTALALSPPNSAVLLTFILRQRRRSPFSSKLYMPLIPSEHVANYHALKARSKGTPVYPCCAFLPPIIRPFRGCPLPSPRY
jgi:hypothetical protein